MPKPVGPCRKCGRKKTYRSKRWRCLPCDNAYRRDVNYPKHRATDNAKSRQWVIEHPDQTKKRQSDWYLNNQERLKAKSRARYYIDPEAIKDRMALKCYETQEQAIADLLENPAPPPNRKYPTPAAFAVNNHRVKKYDAPGKLSRDEFIEIVQSQGDVCIDCGLECNFTIGHLVPLCRGGTNWPYNIVGQCMDCNHHQSRRVHRLTFSRLQNDLSRVEPKWLARYHPDSKFCWPRILPKAA